MALQVDLAALVAVVADLLPVAEVAVVLLLQPTS